MTTSWRYEFKKGKEAKIYVDSNQSNNYCMYRDLLQNGHQLCGVEVYDLLTGPIRNPVREVVEDHTKRRLLSKSNVPEEGGICKYVESSEERFCAFCKMEASIRNSKLKREKELKKVREMEYLMKSIHRIRGTSRPEFDKRYKKSCKEQDGISNDAYASRNKKPNIYCPRACTNKEPDIYCPGSFTHDITSDVSPGRCV